MEITETSITEPITLYQLLLRLIIHYKALLKNIAAFPSSFVPPFLGNDLTYVQTLCLVTSLKVLGGKLSLFTHFLVTYKQGKSMFGRTLQQALPALQQQRHSSLASSLGVRMHSYSRVV